MVFNPLELSVKIEKIVARDSLRKYYRVGRGGQWYGGIATCDCVGCNLRCVFCWSKIFRVKKGICIRIYQWMSLNGKD